MQTLEWLPGSSIEGVSFRQSWATGVGLKGREFRVSFRVQGATSRV